MSQFAAQCLTVNHAGETFLLHPQRVMYWPAKKTLFAADVHMGKEHVFARQGIAIPDGISESTLVQLFNLTEQSGARNLIILGDFMHAVPHSSEHWLNLLSTLLTQHSHVSMQVVAGNHDREAGWKITDERILWHKKPLIMGALVLQHEPSTDNRGYVLCGHVHPVWRISAKRRGSIRAPVFWFREGYAVLPSFGEFTGGAIIKPDRDKDTLYLTGPDCVIPVPDSSLCR